MFIVQVVYNLCNLFSRAIGVSLHQKLINLRKKLDNDKDNKGLCFGFSIRWLEAALLGESELERLENRLVRINWRSVDTLIEKINNAKTNVKKKLPLSKKEEECFELLGFMESLTIAHRPFDYPEIFAKESYLIQDDIEIVSQIVSSNAILERGGLKVLYSEPYVLSEKEIEEYLDQLGEIFDSEASESAEAVGLLLKSISHAVALSYEPNQGWLFRDINQDPTFMITDTKSIARKIMEGFECNPQCPYLAFDTKIILTKSDKRNPSLKTKLDTFKKSNVLTKDTISRLSEDANLVFVAAENGYASKITELAALGANLDLRYEGISSAYIAAQNGHLEAINALAPYLDLNEPVADGCTPIFIAAQNGHVEVVKALVQHGVNINQCNEEGSTPAYVAAQNGHTGVIRALSKPGVDFNKLTNNGFSAAYVAAQNGHAEVIKALCLPGVDLSNPINHGKAPAFIAAKMGHAEVIKALAEHGVNLSTPFNHGYNPAFIAAENGHVNVIKMLAKYGVDLSIPNKHGNTPAHVAAEKNHTEVIHVLAELGVDLNQTNDNGCTPAYFAAQEGNVEVIKALALHEGVDFNKSKSNGCTPAFIAAQNGHAAAITALAEHGADLSKSFNNGCLPLHIAAENGHAEVVRVLAKRGVDLSKSHDNGYTAAFFAAQNGHEEVIKVLAEQGVNLNQSNDIGSTAAFFAAQNGHASVIKVLALHGVDLSKSNNNGGTPGILAAQDGHVAVIKVLAEQGVDLNQANINGCTPAYFAAQNGHVEVIKVLAEHGYDLNKSKNNGCTPAYVATLKGHAEVIKALALHGADLTQSDIEGNTPVMVAAREGHLNVITTLALHGVDLSKSNAIGNTPVYMAAFRGHQDIVKFLLSRRVDISTGYQISLADLKSFAEGEKPDVVSRIQTFIDSQQPDQANNFYLTPFDIAGMMGHGKIVKQLFKHAIKEENSALLSSMLKSPFLTTESALLNPSDEQSTALSHLILAFTKGNFLAISRLKSLLSAIVYYQQTQVPAKTIECLTKFIQENPGLDLDDFWFNNLGTYLAQPVQPEQKTIVGQVLKWFCGLLHDENSTSYWLHYEENKKLECIKERPIYKGIFDFQSTAASNKRVVLMHLLQSQALVKNNNTPASNRGHWSANNNEQLLQHGFEQYQRYLNTCLAATPKPNVALQRHFSTQQQRVLLRVANELAAIGRSELNLSDHSSSKPHLLHRKLEKILGNYHSTWFKSNSRNQHMQQLHAKLQKSSQFEALLQIIKEARVMAMYDDIEENKGRLLKMNRNGQSRYFNTLNQMEDAILKCWTQDSNAIIGLSQYQTCCEEEIILLHQTFSKALQDHIKENKGSFFTKNEIPLEQLFAHIKDFGRQSVQSELFQDSELRELIIDIQQNYALMPGHLKTLANELLIRSESLASHLTESRVSRA